MDLIDRQALLQQIDIDSDGEPGYYGDTWKFIDTIKSMPPATQLGTNLAEVGTDCISRQQAIDAVKSRKTAEQCKEGEVRNWTVDTCVDMIRKLPSAQPEISCSEIPNNSDAISRQAAIDALRRKA